MIREHHPKLALEMYEVLKRYWSEPSGLPIIR